MRWRSRELDLETHLMDAGESAKIMWQHARGASRSPHSHMIQASCARGSAHARSEVLIANTAVAQGPKNLLPLSRLIHGNLLARRCQHACRKRQLTAATVLIRGSTSYGPDFACAIGASDTNTMCVGTSKPWSTDGLFEDMCGGFKLAGVFGLKALPYALNVGLDVPHGSRPCLDASSIACASTG